MDPQLCDECAKLSSSEWDHGILGGRSWTIEDIALTAPYCPYCAIIFASVDTILDHNPLFHNRDLCNQDTISVPQFFGLFRSAPDRRCVRYRYADTEEEVEYDFEFSVFRVPQPQKDDLAQADPVLTFWHGKIPTSFILPSSTQSQDSVRQTKLWLKKCMETHQLKCTPLSEEEKWQPRRLLRVRKLESTYNVQLVELEDGEKVEYFCLSHCWGVGRAHFMTTPANLAERKHAISWDDIPTLFRQALEFTHLLGEEYLWIDSLCIIQGDHLDWSVESKKMAAIYQNAKLTLAASLAANSNEDLFGFLKDSERGIRVKGLESVGVVDDIFVRELLPHTLEELPLLSRAWVYQERMLSPRFLHFSAQELIWECNTEVLCQCSRKDVIQTLDAPIMTGDTVEGRKKEGFWHHIEWNQETKAFELRRKVLTWNMIVTDYSSHAITYRQDRLPAIAGMAKKFQQLGQDGRYLAGLWENTFVKNLMWQAVSQSASMPRCAEWIAPTWSWASAGAGVQFYHEQLGSELEVSSRIKLVDAFCEPVHGDDDTMNLKSAFMTIRGPTFTALVRHKISHLGQSQYWLERDGIESFCFHVDYDLLEPGTFQVNPRSQVLCMEAGIVSMRYREWKMYALVCKRFSNGEHHRIGVVEWDEDIRGISEIAEVATIVVF